MLVPLDGFRLSGPITACSFSDSTQELCQKRVDFIKMDIEGAEPQALIGAENTLRKYRPRLAICIYHDVRHFAEIPNWINNLGLGYKFYVDHFTIHAEETILFART